MIAGGGNYTTWTLVVPAAAVAASSTTIVPPATQLSFLGYGLLTPFRRGSANDFAAAGGAALAKSRISQVLGTARSTKTTPGELPWRGDFGVQLTQLRHVTKNLFLGKMAQHFVMDALAQWEPTTRVSATIALPNPKKPRATLLRVSYDLVTSNPTGNRVALPGQSVDIPLAPTAG